MQKLDLAGHRMTVASQEAAEAWNATVEHFLAHDRETPQALARVLAADPHCTLAWCAKGLFTFLLARAELSAVVQEALGQAEACVREGGATAREELYVEALRRAAAGSFKGCIAALEQVLDDEPTDSLAAKLSHALRFMLGDCRGMRTSIEHVLERAGVDHVHLGYLLGCRAFALEETGAYREAETIGRRAIERAARDAWGLHAVSHVHEMTGRAQEGAAFLEAHQGYVAHCNNFGYHVFWHLALFRLELGDIPATLRLYDERVRAARTDDFRDIANAASLLTRLALAGADVGTRWDELADLAERRITDQTLIFADLHYLLALIGAGRKGAAEQLALALAGPNLIGDQKTVAAEVGAAAAEALVAFGEERYGQCAQTLIELRPRLVSVGGSHAQRDVFEQMLIEAAVRGGLEGAARGLLLERLSTRGTNQFAAERLAKLKLARTTQRAQAAGVPTAALLAPKAD